MRELSNNTNEKEMVPGSKAGKVLRLELKKLLGGGDEAIIVHNGEDYRLRLTARGKLILTK